MLCTLTFVRQGLKKGSLIIGLHVVDVKKKN